MTQIVIKLQNDEKTNRLLIWQETSNLDPTPDEEICDILDKAISVGIEIPFGRENAISKDDIVQKIISNLTYSL